MKLLGSTKSFVALLSLGSMVVLAGTINDMRTNSDSFMQDDEIQVVRRFDDSLIRNVASAERELPAAQYLPVNKENESQVNGKWEIRVIQNDDEAEVFNANNSEMKLIVDFEMIGTSLVRIDKDNEMVFDISLLHESGSTIALFRSFGKGYEIIEARRVRESKAKKIAKKAVVASSQIEKKSGVVVTDTQDLVLERALHPTKDSNMLKGELITGSVTVAAGTIENFTATIGIGRKYETSIDISFADINDGGQFEADIDGEMVTGLLTNNGKDAYRVRFVTGKLAGAMLNFVTEEELNKIEEQNMMAQEEAEEKAEQTRYEEGTEEVAQKQAPVNSRVINAAATNIYELEDEENLTDEELAEIEAEEFEGDEEQREPASVEEMNNAVAQSGFSF
jgi:hypothetical protein